MYTPSEEILNKYANVLINFALGGGKGIKKSETVFLQGPECSKPLLFALQAITLKSGGNPIIRLLPDEAERNYLEFSRQFFELASDEQLTFFPEAYIKGLVEQMDHIVSIIATKNKQNLKGIDPKKIMMRQKAYKPYMDMRNEKEGQGKLTWTLALYGTDAMAKEVNMTEEEYWEQIINACYLAEEDPVKKWQQAYDEINRVKSMLNELKIQRVRVEAEGTDLVVGLGNDRTWLGGSGRNIPSFELFISPDWRKTQGHISFNQPLYRYGNLIKDVYLKFENGLVVDSKASEGEDVLKQMIATENADKIGEFSLTDGRLSKITRFMAETLYDENAGGEFGNTHIALGMAYKDSFPGDIASVSKEEWENMGYNDSSVHTDIVSTTKRRVTAYLEDGSERVIYENGRFTI